MADARPTFSIWRSDIRKRKQTQFSRPMTGHTPQKLPRFRAISCIIAVRVFVFRENSQTSPTHARIYYHACRYLSRTILEKITKIFTLFRSLQRFPSPLQKAKTGAFQPRFEIANYSASTTSSVSSAAGASRARMDREMRLFSASTSVILTWTSWPSARTSSGLPMRLSAI